MNMRFSLRKGKRLGVVLFIGVSLTTIRPEGLTGLEALAAVDPFPLYECIKPNVEFWKKIYGQYNSTQGVIHDSWNLSVIYDVIDLLDGEQRGAQKINKNRIKSAKEKVEGILERLALGNPPCSPEERRIADLFGPKAGPEDFRKAKGNIRCQVGQRDRFQEGVIRSGAFLADIKEIFISHGLPADLAYLPHVESSFNHNAYSKFGAAGIWQFTRSTGKRFMEIGYTLDERRDPIGSSMAAARLLKEHYETLGDWSMAITAYNHGQAGMLRAKEAKGDYQAIFEEYQGRLFKFASRNFYPEFLAALHVAKNYKEYFGELNFDKPLKRHEIVLAGHVPIKDLVRHFGVDISEIRSLNPSLREPVYAGRKYIPKGYALRLPIDAKGVAGSHLTALPQDLYKPDQRRSLFYKVQKGDTASDIARVHGVSLSELIMANDLDTRARVYMGQNLRLPAMDEKPGRLAMAKAGEEKEVEPGGSDSSPGAAARPQDERPKGRPGEGPSQVFRKEVTTKMSPVNLAVVTGDLVVEKRETRKGKLIGTITVEVEETLGHYADWLDVATQEIRALNGLKYGTTLRLHESVSIPLDKVSKEAFEEKRFEYHKEMEEDFFASYKIDSIETYKIKNGDNIWTLCKEIFEIPLWLVIKYNPSIDFNALKVSQEIVIPAVEEIATKGPRS